VKAASALAFALALTATTTASARPCATASYEHATRALGLTHAHASRPFAKAKIVDSALYPIRVLYQGDELSVYAPPLIAALEAAWTDIVVDGGYPAPLADDGAGGSDALDVYIMGIGPGIGALTIADADASPDDGRHAASAHIRIDPFTIGDALQSFVHHEFFHVVQFGIDRSESLMFFESTAVYQEILFVDGEARFENIADFQAHPNAPPFADGIDFNPSPFDLLLYEYGASLFIAYLDEELGQGDGSLIRDLWLASVQSDAVVENEPDWMDALAARGTPIEETTLDFATWRALVATYAQDDDGPSFASELGTDTLVAARALDAVTLDGRPLVVAGNGAPHQSGCVVFRVTNQSGASKELEIEGRFDDASDRPLSFASAMGPPNDLQRASVDGEGGHVSTTLSLASGSTLLGALCDVGPADADDDPSPTTLTYSVWDTAVEKYVPPVDAGEPEPDAEPEPSPEPEPMPFICGCQQALPDGGPFGELRRVVAPAFIFVSLGLFAFRVRRAMKRRKSYVGSSTGRSSTSAPTRDTASSP